MIELYGESAQEVKVFRDFRDKVLDSTPEGQELISLYNAWSPVIVKTMEKDPAFKEEVKRMIDTVFPLIKGIVR